jgi:hypothetical protein
MKPLRLLIPSASFAGVQRLLKPLLQFFYFLIGVRVHILGLIPDFFQCQKEKVKLPFQFPRPK